MNVLIVFPSIAALRQWKKENHLPLGKYLEAHNEIDFPNDTTWYLRQVADESDVKNLCGCYFAAIFEGRPIAPELFAQLKPLIRAVL